MSSSAEPIKDVFVQQQILDAAKRLFQTYGLYKVTMDDVAKAIGKGRSSLYYYYKSKEEIFDAVMRVEIREMLNEMTVAVTSANNIEEKLNGFCISKIGFLRERRSFFDVLVMGMDADAMHKFKEVKIVHHELIMQQESALLELLLNGAMAKAEIRYIEKKEMPMLVFLLLTGVRGIKREMEMTNNFDNMESIVRSFTRLVLNGLKN